MCTNSQRPKEAKGGQIAKVRIRTRVSRGFKVRTRGTSVSVSHGVRTREGGGYFGGLWSGSNFGGKRLKHEQILHRSQVQRYESSSFLRGLGLGPGARCLREKIVSEGLANTRKWSKHLCCDVSSFDLSRQKHRVSVFAFPRMNHNAMTSPQQPEQLLLLHKESGAVQFENEGLCHAQTVGSVLKFG